MRLSKHVEGYLKREPKFRERKNKDKGILNIIFKIHPHIGQLVLSGQVSKELLVAVLQDYATMDRSWRKMLADNRDLRGSDYDRKDHLEKKTLVDLGYRAPEKVGEELAVDRQIPLL